MSTNYGTQVRWSSASAPDPTGGICENYDYQEQYDEDEVDSAAGELGALVLPNLRGNISFESTLDATSLIPILGEDGACKVAITGLATGGVLFQQIVERWRVGQARTLQCRAVHYPELGAGGSSSAATTSAPDEQASPPLIIPGGRVFWGTNGVASALGLVQSFEITQTIQHKVYPEEGKIVAVVCHKYMMQFQLEVLAKAGQTRPANGGALALSTAPARFADTNVITDSQERFRKEDGVMFSITAKWAPSFVVEEE